MIWWRKCKRKRLSKIRPRNLLGQKVFLQPPSLNYQTSRKLRLPKVLPLSRAVFSAGWGKNDFWLIILFATMKYFFSKDSHKKYKWRKSININSGFIVVHCYLAVWFPFFWTTRSLPEASSPNVYGNSGSIISSFHWTICHSILKVKSELYSSMQQAGVALNSIFRWLADQYLANNVECGSSKVAKDMEFRLVVA